MPLAPRPFLNRQQLAAFALLALALGLPAALPAASARVNVTPEVDADYHPPVPHPAYDGEQHPAVWIDEGHREAFTAAGRLRPFTELLTRDGYRVKAYKGALQQDRLAATDILVIVDPLGAGAADRPAFSPAEIETLRGWVEAGGSLLLAAGPAPAGRAAASLAKAFGVEMSQGQTFDPEHTPDATPTTWIAYTRASGLLGDTLLTHGRDDSERVDTAVTFRGQSLRGPEDSTALLRLGDAALDRFDDGDTLGAAGHAQAIYLERGKGRVLVLGDPALLTAQQVGNGALKIGMNRPGNDDRQLTLNLLHWLSHLLNS
ncbi:MAG TPA: DUF4350 domain-containing protein [Thermoanaerobaculia bacterium]|nr:DUF4350 domain-containing protein [Thermoanaerobaculia bacterium]